MSIPRFTALCVAAGVVVSTGCHGDSLLPPLQDANTVFWSLDFNQKAVTLATGESLRLIATPHTKNGTVITTLPAATFVSSDTTEVVVASDGTITGKNPGSFVQVTATLSAPGKNLTNSATVWVNVVATRPSITKLSIQPGPMDSTRLAAGSQTSIQGVGIAPNGDEITGFSLAYWTSDPTIASIDPVFGSLTGMNVGTVMVYAQGTVAGTTYTDSVRYTITYPIMATINILMVNSSLTSPLYFTNTDLTLMKGAVVTWGNNTRSTFGISFDDSLNVTGGNISQIPNGKSDARQFNVPGTYVFRNTLNGQTGKLKIVTQ